MISISAAPPRPHSLRLPIPQQKRWQNMKFGADIQDDYEDENLYEVSGRWGQVQSGGRSARWVGWSPRAPP